MTKRFLVPLSTDHVDFNLDNPSDYAEGRLWWNDEENTLDLGMLEGVTQSMGMHLYMPPTKNNSGVQIPKGSFVMATGAQGDRITIAKAVTDGSVEPEYMIGIAAADIPNESEDGLIVTNGTVFNMNTNSWNVGTILYPDPAVAGGLTASVPSSPAIKTPIAIVLRKQTNAGRIYVRMTNGSKLGSTDSNVEFSNLQNNDVLTYDSSNGIWKNLPVAKGAGVDIGDVFPSSPSAGALFFRVSSLALYIYIDGAWLETGSVPLIDGGNVSTISFDGEIDGGEPGTTFIGGISGGTVDQEFLLT